MEITFLIGNGFDLNLGLKTRYSDFLEWYLAQPSHLPEILDFKNHIQNHMQSHMQGDPSSIQWSDAEIAFGQYTDVVAKEPQNAEVFCQRHEDFCRRLAEYLENEESYFLFRAPGSSPNSRRFLKAFNESILKCIQDTIHSSPSPAICNFIIFNYTTIIDKIAPYVVQDGRYHIKELVHVHGTTTDNMILGVNDISQLKNPALFDNVSRRYMESMIKPESNHSNGAEADAKCLDIIQRSSIFVVYGMSLGDTDRIWWQRIINQLAFDPTSQAFIYCFDAPSRRLLNREFLIYSDQKIQQFLAHHSHPSLEAAPPSFDPEDLARRIHILDNSLFKEISDFSKGYEYDSSYLVPYEPDASPSFIEKLLYALRSFIGIKS